MSAAGELVASAGKVVETDTRPEVAAEGVRCLDDPRLNEHLPRCNVHSFDQTAHLIEFRWDVLNENDIGARIDHSTAALRQDLLGRIREYFLERLGLLIVELERLGSQGFQIGDLGLGFECQFLLGCQLVARRDPDHVARLAHIKALGLENNVQRLIPGYVLESQGQISGDRVAGDDIQIGEVGDHLQHSAHFDVLEVQRQLVAGIALAGLLLTRGILDDRLHFNDKALIGLVGGLFPASLGHQRDARVAALFHHLEGIDLGSEVRHVEAPLQRRRQRGLQEVHDDASALLPEVDSGPGVRQVDNDLRFAILAAPKVHVLDVMGFRHRLGLGELGRACIGRRSRDAGSLQRDDHRIALGTGFILRHLGQVQHYTGTSAGLSQANVAQIPLIDILGVLAEAVRGIRKIECDARRVVHSEGGRRGRQRVFKTKFDGHDTTLGRNVHRLDDIARDGARFGFVLGLGTGA